MPSKTAFLDVDMLNKMPYLDMVVNESMRILPVVPFVTRQTNAEIVLDGYTVPKGAEILIPILKIHTNPKFWGDDANVFRPERFEKEAMKNIHPYAYIPFTSEFYGNFLVYSHIFSFLFYFFCRGSTNVLGI